MLAYSPQIGPLPGKPGKALRTGPQKRFLTTGGIPPRAQVSLEPGKLEDREETLDGQFIIFFYLLCISLSNDTGNCDEIHGTVCVHTYHSMWDH